MRDRVGWSALYPGGGTGPIRPTGSILRQSMATHPEQGFPPALTPPIAPGIHAP